MFADSPDEVFYERPFLDISLEDPTETRIIMQLTEYYEAVLPREGTVLDLCSSFRSHYGHFVEEAVVNGKLEVYGIGMNYSEMSVSKALIDRHNRHVVNLNEHPFGIEAIYSFQEPEPRFDAVTCNFSIEFLIRPRLVL